MCPRVADKAVLTRAMIKDMFWATCISISVVSAVNVLLWVWGALVECRDSVTMAPKFTPDEEAEIELMLWEYDRDGRIAIDNFFRREPELSLRMAGGIIPKRIQRDLIAFLQALRRR